jgi:hypothetical protein
MLFRKKKNIEVEKNEMSYLFTLKRSIRRGYWQIKSPQQHEYYSLIAFSDLINEIITGIGCDPKDTGNIYELIISIKGIEGYQTKLKKGYEDSEVVEFEIEENRMGTNKDKGWLPKIMLNRFQRDYIYVYILIRKANTKALKFFEAVDL